MRWNVDEKELAKLGEVEVYILLKTELREAFTYSHGFLVRHT